MSSTPQAEHQWLQKFVGEWTYENEGVTEPGQPPCRSTGTERVRSIGGLWVVAEGEGTMPDGAPALSIMTLGYDPQTKRYQSTWIGSMMTHLWLCDGELDSSGRVLTLSADGPSFDGTGKTAKYQDVIEFKSDDHRVLYGQVLQPDGEWKRFMTVHYRRAK